MQLAEHVPMTNAVETGRTKDGDELHFCSLADAVAAFAAETAGKILFVSDGEAPALAFAARLKRAISVVLDGADALPLFPAPDTVGAVFAAGGESTLIAARFFASVRRVPCAVAPTDGACFGIFGDMGSVFLDGASMEMPLARAKIFCDVALMEPRLDEARARLLLARLARFEARALSAFGSHREQLCAAEGNTPEEIVRANAALRRSEAAGAWRGEGATLARLYPKPAAFRAFYELSALYAAFFGCGRPRKYVVPDYAARAKRAGVSAAEVCIPTAEEYARRALVLERRRSDLLAEVQGILRGAAAETRSVCAFLKKNGGIGGISDALETLPEHCPNGLTAIIRDFGLLERT